MYKRQAKWIYERKEGIIEVEDARWKVRVVVRGYNQKEGIDYNEMLSPVRKTYRSLKTPCLIKVSLMKVNQVLESIFWNVGRE